MFRITFLLALGLLINKNLCAQIAPLDSPYYSDGSYAVEIDSNLTDLSIPLLFYRPQISGVYPVLMFQIGANGFGSTAINRHSYDLFLNHLASYGFVVIVIDDSQAGLPNGASFMEAHDWYTTNINDPQHWLYNYADPNNFIVGGHSNGGVNACALLVDRPTEVDGIVFMDAYPSEGIFGIGAHDVSGYTGKEMTLSANENDPASNKNGYDSFTSVECKTFVDITGLDHGGFGDYDLATQPVGPIGRDSATATIRHFFVSWMLGEFKGDVIASNHLANPSLHPGTVEQFLNNCGSLSANIEEENINDNLLLYPNPVSDGKVIIEFGTEECEVNIYSLTGELVLITTDRNINCSELPQGAYDVKVQTEMGVYNSRFIKN